MRKDRLSTHGLAQARLKNSPSCCHHLLGVEVIGLQARVACGQLELFFKVGFYLDS